MRWWHFGVLAMLAATVSEGAPKAKAKGKPKPSPWLDVPTMAQTGSPTERSVMTVQCQLVAGSTPRVIDCDLTQAMLTGPPSTAKVADQLAELDESAKKKKQKAELYRTLCSKKNVGEMKARSVSPPERDFLDKFLSSCAKKSADALFDALRWRVSNIEAHTCGLSAYNSIIQFTQQNADTWVSVSTGVLCSTTTTATLWRKAGDFLWNYRQVRVVPPNADPKLCLPLTQTPTEWRWDARKTSDIGCKYIEM